MYDNDSKGLSYSAGFFMLIAFAVAGQILSVILIMPVWQQMTGLGLDQMEKNMSNPAYSDVMKAVQAINAIAGFLIPAIVTAAVLNRRPMKLLGFSPRIKLSQVGIVIVMMCLAMLVSISLAYFNQQIPLPHSWKVLFDKWENNYSDTLKGIVVMKSTTDFLLALLVMGFLPALCEEALFRGGLQNFLSRSTKSPWISIIIVSILFSAVHISFYGFLTRFFLGVVLGAIYHYTGKLWLSVLGHFINNAIGVTLLYVYIKQGRPMEEAIKQEPDFYWGLIFLPVVLLGLYLLKRVSVNRRVV